MRSLLVLIVICFTFLAAPATAASPTFQTARDGEGVAFADAEEQGVEASPDAIEQDVALVAEGNGWTLDEARTSHYAAERIGQMAEQVARERPDVYVGAALADQPGGAATLYVRGPADQFIRDLVETSDIPIILADNQPFSFDELEVRKLQVHHFLEALGFRYVATSVNITGAGTIPTAITLQPDLPSSVEDILLGLPAGLRSSVELTIHTKPIVTDFAAFGGMWVLDDGLSECTSGWSVRNLASSDLGISTAGHCTGINQVNHPGHGIHAINFGGEHRGQWGDVEWHPSAELEPDDFYADAVNIRDVAAIEPRGNIVVGESVCVYGRSSNDRDCSLEVQDVSQACTNNGVFNDRLVMMNGVTSIGGDSGGGWSFGNTAYGSVKGLCAPDFLDREVWSVADLYDEALGVKVTCGC